MAGMRHPGIIRLVEKNVGRIGRRRHGVDVRNRSERLRQLVRPGALLERAS